MSTFRLATWKPSYLLIPRPSACKWLSHIAGGFSAPSTTSYNCARWRLSSSSGRFILNFDRVHMLALHRPTQFVFGHFAVFALAAWSSDYLALPAVAQVNAVAATSSSSNSPAPPASAQISSQRDSEYAALARDVESLGREFALVKRVVKLVTPAVVHIESKPLPKYQ